MKVQAAEDSCAFAVSWTSLLRTHLSERHRKSSTVPRSYSVAVVEGLESAGINTETDAQGIQKTLKKFALRVITKDARRSTLDARLRQ
jgi:hypothetical protein